MQRWNGWGDESVVDELPAAGAAAIERLVGPATPGRDATLAEVVAAVPASRLPAHRLVVADPEVRVRHARGQSLPDWVALRSGRLGAVPDGVAFPDDAAEVRELLAWAAAVGSRVVPYGGGTSVVGGVTPAADGAPWLTISLAHQAGLRELDEGSLLATFGAGTVGPDVEAALRARKLTLGHYPQSWELSTVGGWVAARSSGQQSAGYGRIEALFAGGSVEAPAGSLVMPPHPASAAGPDLRQAILGSEGRLGILTQAVLRAAPQPEVEAFPALFLPDWERALGIHAGARPGAPPAGDGSHVDPGRDVDEPRAGRPRANARGASPLPGREGRRPGPLHGPARPRRIAPGRRGNLSRGARPGPRVRRRQGARDVRAPVATGSIPGAVPPERPVERGVRRRHPGDGGRVGPRPRDGGVARPGDPARPCRGWRARARLHPPLPCLPDREQPLHDLRLPPCRRPGRDAGQVGSPQGAGVRGDRPAGRDHQPPARGGDGPRGLPAGREGGPGDGGPGRSLPAASTRTASCTRASCSRSRDELAGPRGASDHGPAGRRLARPGVGAASRTAPST